MGLREVEQIDSLTIEVIDGVQKAVLYLIDNGDVTDEMQRDALFTTKLANYAAYVFSSDFQSRCPEMAPSDAIIRVVYMTPLTECISQAHSIGPKGETIRVPVVIESLEEFNQRMDQLDADVPPKPWWKF